MSKEEVRPESQTAFEEAVGILIGKIDLMPDVHKQDMREIAIRSASAPGDVLHVSGERINAGGSIEYDPI